MGLLETLNDVSERVGLSLAWEGEESGGWDGMSIYFWGPGRWVVGEVEVVADGAAEAAAGDGGGRGHGGGRVGGWVGLEDTSTVRFWERGG